MTTFNIGESVSLLREVGYYSIVRLDHPYAIVQDEHGFEYQVNITSLIKRMPIHGKVVNKEPTTISTTSKKKHELQIPTLDLHASALGLDNTPSNELLEIKLNHCRKFLNQCIEKRQSKALIIHGVGEGVLKTAVRKLLDGNPGINYHDGNYSVRGIGSTLVEIKLSQVTRF
ncbi:MAG: Smr/MutS family protein [Flavobacteriales bacterium]